MLHRAQALNCWMDIVLTCFTNPISVSFKLVLCLHTFSNLQESSSILSSFFLIAELTAKDERQHSKSKM